MNKSKMTYESALSKIEKNLDLLESNQLSLEESTAVYKESMELIEFCNKCIEEARLKITELKKGGDVVD